MPSLLDSFTGLEVIGTGAGSTIFRGVYRGDGRVYAIKHIRWTRKGDERFFRQAANEYRVASHFEHENIVKMHDFQRLRKYLKAIECAVIMDYFRGRMLSPRNKFSMADLIGIFVQISKALSYMHQLGYVHTDVKPENILANDSAGAVLIDFGVACKRSERKDRVQGTPEFMAPEQLSKKPLDERTDIYNLGTTMYKVLTGKVAPENVRMASPLANGFHDNVLSLVKSSVRDHNVSVPERFAHIIEKSSRRSRSKRFQRMREVTDELLACLKEVAPPNHHLLKEPA